MVMRAECLQLADATCCSTPFLLSFSTLPDVGDQWHWQIVFAEPPLRPLAPL